MRQMERTQAAIAWPPFNAAGSPACLSRTSRVMSPVSSILRTAAWRVNRLPCSGCRHSVFEIGADWQRTSRPSVAMAPQPRWMTAQARTFGTLHPLQMRDGQDDCPAQRPAALRVGRFRKGPAPAAHTSGVGGLEPDQAYRLGPAGLAAGPRLHHPGSARRSSAVMRASAWRRMSEPAWWSMAHQSSTVYVVATLPLARS